MGYEKKLVRSFSRTDPQKLGLGLLAGFIIVPFIYCSMSRTPFPISISRLATGMAPTTTTPAVDVNVALISEVGHTENKNSTKPVCVGAEPSSIPGEKAGIISINSSNSSESIEAPSPKINENSTNSLDTDTRNQTHVAEFKPLQLKTEANSSSTATATGKETATKLIQLERKPLCTLDRRSDLCDISGDVRIHGISSTVLLFKPNIESQNETWQVQPYARKSDLAAMSHVRKVRVKSSNSSAPQCSVFHQVPAIVFSIAGYTGNYFHDFTDVLVPLFLTAREFAGDVQFLVADLHPWWVHKYSHIFKKLSNYEVINFNKDDRVHCFRRSLVGLRTHKELSIDPLQPPYKYSMKDFTRFMREAYSLPREEVTPATILENPNKKPRLLIISRKKTRKFVNVNKITRLAEKLGFEVIVYEAQPDVPTFAGVVNSCDVMLGVHGAALTNIVFLPVNALLIQVVPWGKLDWIANTYFRDPANDMGIRYLDYKAKEEESSLVDEYPKDHAVFTDPMSIHRLGWIQMKEIYLKQDVRINVRKFRSVLKSAFKMLQHN